MLKKFILMLISSGVVLFFSGQAFCAAATKSTVREKAVLSKKRGAIKKGKLKKSIKKGQALKWKGSFSFKKAPALVRKALKDIENRKYGAYDDLVICVGSSGCYVFGIGVKNQQMRRVVMKPQLGVKLGDVLRLNGKPRGRIKVVYGSNYKLLNVYDKVVVANRVIVWGGAKSLNINNPKINTALTTLFSGNYRGKNIVIPEFDTF